MLGPDYLDELPAELVRLWQQVEDDILREAAWRLGQLEELDPLTPTAAWQLYRLAETQALQRDIVRLLAKYSGRSDAAIRRALTAGCTQALGADDAIHRLAHKTPGDVNASPALRNLLNAGYRQTRGSWRNLTATTAATVAPQFAAAMDRAWLQVASGAFSYTAAIRQTVEGLAGDLKTVTYPSGHRDRLEVAVRRCVLTGVNQTTAKLQLARMQEMGCRHVEVTAHAGARSDGSKGPRDHAWWQGKVYSLGKLAGAQETTEKTEEKTVAGFTGKAYNTDKSTAPPETFAQYIARVPEATEEDYRKYLAVRDTGINGQIRVPAEKIDAEALTFRDEHAARHGCTVEDARRYVENAVYSARNSRWDNESINFFSHDGAAYVDEKTMKIKASFPKEKFDDITSASVEVFDEDRILPGTE